MTKKLVPASGLFETIYDAETQKAVSLPKEFKLLVGDGNDPAVPVAHASYVFERTLLRDVLSFMLKPHSDALFLSGPTGCGKTSVINEVCARLHWPVQQVTCNGRMEFQSLKGQFVLKASAPGETPAMTFEYGPLARAMKEGHVLILNEIDMCDPSELAGLNDVLEGRPLVISENGGEVIKPHPNFRVVATANSAGKGDESGFYSGVQVQNMASMDRYRFLKVNYLPEKVEEEIVRKSAPFLADPAMKKIVSGMVKFASEIRKRFEDGTLSVTMSTRSLCRWAMLTADCKSAAHPLHYAFERTLGFRCAPDEMAALDMIGNDHIQFGAIWK